ncbi:MAG: ribosome maturation factor RimP [Rhodospirillaceae bacterium]|nr:ribosome maturation factor RimP [Rhodospirillaceae bacterium]
MERLTWLEEKISPTLEAMGFEVVRVAVTGEGGVRALQIMADRADGSLINIDDCTVISVTLNDIFEADDPLEGAYNLEVSSAGIDRPLTRPKDFDAYVGFEAKLQTRRPINGRKKYCGVLEGLTADDAVNLVVDGESVSLPLSELDRAQLVLTDELIAETENSQRHPQHQNINAQSE